MHIVEKRVPVQNIFIRKELVRLSSKPLGKVLAKMVKELPELIKVSRGRLMSCVVENTEHKNFLNTRDFFLRYPEIPLLSNQEEAVVALDMALESKKLSCAKEKKNIFLYRGEKGTVDSIQYLCPNTLGEIEVVIVPQSLIEISSRDIIFYFK